MRILLGLLALVGFAAAGSYEYDYNGHLHFFLSLGTPEQGPFEFTFPAFLDRFGHHCLTVSNKKNGGFYNSNASSTFRFVDIIDKHYSNYNGTDIVHLQNGPKAENIVVDVISRDFPKGYVTLASGENGKRSFLDQILESLGGDRTMVWAIKKSTRESHDGTLILGNATPKQCSRSWSTFAASNMSTEQLVFNSTELEIGKFHYVSKLPTAFDADSLWLSYEVYKIAEKELKIKNGKLDCDTKIPIILTAGDLVWTIGPEDYMRRYPTECVFDVLKTASPITRLPLRFLNGQCVRFDFGKKTVSISDKRS